MYMYFKKDQIYPYKAVQKNPQNNSDTINDRDYEVIWQLNSSQIT